MSEAKKRIAVIPGDGIGKEVIPEAVKVLKSAAARGSREVSFTEFDWGADRFLRDGTTLPADAAQMFQLNDPTQIDPSQFRKTGP
jgi:isocitrate/isopropylmalate dehydrogenase